MRHFNQRAVDLFHTGARVQNDDPDREQGRRDDDGNRVELDVSVGDTVLYAKYAGTEVKVDGKKLLILKESDILALVG